MKRRTLLKLTTGLSLATMSPSAVNAADCTSPLAEAASDKQQSSLLPKPTTKAVYIPGYRPVSANSEGMEFLDHPELSRGIPDDYDGPVRMMTRLGLNGDVAQALYPVYGHDVKISPDGKIGFYGSLEYDSYVCFDPDSLDVVALGKPFQSDWIGGGHGLFLNEGTVLALSERAPKLGYRGAPSKHFGRVTLRDPQTLKVLDSISSHGVSPHDIRLLADGKHMAIANYGTTVAAGESEYDIPRHIVEPSVTIVEISSGKLVEKYMTRSSDKELRHLCAVDFDTIFAIQAEMKSKVQDQYFREDQRIAYENDITVGRSDSYFPAATLRKNPESNKFEALGSDQLQLAMRHGLSIDHDPIHNEIIATYPTSHTIMAFDAVSGEVKHHFNTAALGLDYPCGLVILPDPAYYAVTGYWKNLYIFERGTHRLVRELCHYNTFFGHSHIAAI